MKKIINILFFVFIFSLMLDGAKAWFFWFLYDPTNYIYKHVFLAIGALVSLEYCKYNAIKLLKNKNIFIGLISFFIICNFVTSFSVKGLLDNLFYIFIVWVLLSDVQNASSHLRKVINVLAFILLPGIILHLYILKNGLLPGVPIEFPTNRYYLFINYFFLLKGFLTYEADGIRFQSIFLEPGYCATFLVFILYSIRFDFRKYKGAVIILIGVVLSLSLSGYILGAIGYVCSQWSKQIKLRKYFIICILMLFVYILEKDNPFFKEKILDRLEYDSEKGIAGNNRTGSGADFYFEQSLKNGDFIFGMGGDRIRSINGGDDWNNSMDYSSQIRGAGYKIYILYHGIVPIFFFILSYFYLGIHIIGKTRYFWGYFTIVGFTFIVTSYPEAFSWIGPFILGILTTKYYSVKSLIYSSRRYSLCNIYQ